VVTIRGAPPSRAEDEQLAGYNWSPRRERCATVSQRRASTPIAAHLVPFICDGGPQRRRAVRARQERADSKTPRLKRAALPIHSRIRAKQSVFVGRLPRYPPVRLIGRVGRAAPRLA